MSELSRGHSLPPIAKSRRGPNRKFDESETSETVRDLQARSPLKRQVFCLARHFVFSAPMAEAIVPLVYGDHAHTKPPQAVSPLAGTDPKIRVMLQLTAGLR